MATKLAHRKASINSRTVGVPQTSASTARSGKRSAGAAEEAAPAERLPLRAVLALVWGTPTVLLLMLAFLCANFVAMVLLAWMPGYLAEGFGLSLALAGLTARA